jgi:hypothetical protein
MKRRTAATITGRLVGKSHCERRDECSRAGLESDGLLQAEMFLSRPKADAEAAPLDEIVTVSSGRFNQFGGRFVQIQDEGGVRIAVEA